MILSKKQARLVNKLIALLYFCIIVGGFLLIGKIQSPLISAIIWSMIAVVIIHSQFFIFRGGVDYEGRWEEYLKKEEEGKKEFEKNFINLSGMDLINGQPTDIVQKICEITGTQIITSKKYNKIISLVHGHIVSQNQSLTPEELNYIIRYTCCFVIRHKINNHREIKSTIEIVLKQYFEDRED